MPKLTSRRFFITSVDPSRLIVFSTARKKSYSLKQHSNLLHVQIFQIRNMTRKVGNCNGNFKLWTNGNIASTFIGNSCSTAITQAVAVSRVKHYRYSRVLTSISDKSVTGYLLTWKKPRHTTSTTRKKGRQLQLHSSVSMYNYNRLTTAYSA